MGYQEYSASPLVYPLNERKTGPMSDPHSATGPDLDRLAEQLGIDPRRGKKGDDGLRKRVLAAMEAAPPTAARDAALLWLLRRAAADPRLCASKEARDVCEEHIRAVYAEVATEREPARG